jgi:hypothetical protein
MAFFAVVYGQKNPRTRPKNPRTFPDKCIRIHPLPLYYVPLQVHDFDPLPQAALFVSRGVILKPMPRRSDPGEPTPQEVAFAIARLRGSSPIEAYELAYPPRHAGGNGSRSRHAIAVEASRVGRRPAVQFELDRLQRQLADEIAVADPRVRLAEARILLRQIQDGRCADRERGAAAVSILRDAERQLRCQAREERRLLNILISRPRLAATLSAATATESRLDTTPTSESAQAPIMETDAAPIPSRSPLPTSLPPTSPSASSLLQTTPSLPPDETLAVHVRARQAAIHAPPEPLGTTTSTYRGFGSGGAFPTHGGRE